MTTASMETMIATVTPSVLMPTYSVKVSTTITVLLISFGEMMTVLGVDFTDCDVVVTVVVAGY